MRGDVTDAGQTTDEQVKIELLSQWKLEAESRNFSLIYFCVIMALYRFEMGTRSIFSESFSRNQGFLWSSLRNCSIPVALPANPALQRLHFCSWGLKRKNTFLKNSFAAGLRRKGESMYQPLAVGLHSLREGVKNLKPFLVQGTSRPPLDRGQGWGQPLPQCHFSTIKPKTSWL